MNKKIIKLTDGNYVIRKNNNDNNKPIKKCVIIEFYDDKLINDNLSDDELLDIVAQIVKEKQKKQKVDELKELQEALQVVVTEVGLEKPYDLLSYIDRIKVSAKIVNHALEGKIPLTILQKIRDLGDTDKGRNYLKQINLYGIYFICENLNDNEVF